MLWWVEISIKTRSSDTLAVAKPSSSALGVMCGILGADCPPAVGHSGHGGKLACRDAELAAKLAQVDRRRLQGTWAHGCAVRRVRQEHMREHIRAGRDPYHRGCKLTASSALLLFLLGSRPGSRRAEHEADLVRYTPRLAAKSGLA